MRLANLQNLTLKVKSVIADFANSEVTSIFSFTLSEAEGWVKLDGSTPLTMKAPKTLHHPVKPLSLLLSFSKKMVCIYSALCIDSIVAMQFFAFL